LNIKTLREKVDGYSRLQEEHIKVITDKIRRCMQILTIRGAGGLRTELKIQVDCP
jgi:hypothetical protein